MRREHCAGDRRGRLAVLTGEGVAALQAAAPQHVAGVREHLIDLLSPEQPGRLEQISKTVPAHLTGRGDADEV
ncbi:hypothetical protein HCN51_44085 [Nonomuraea sp. FMUSA5-5]|uniref:MarR family transcriptional regulator n=1 Tax=Nonomuraea composti TaxID=2720023 RepID=A0ABX1BEZ8_9ACTN|nr:hypothetical protein [Nonomuraea sp. FMUSA5-5]NJP96338.1 hypothetical protein [Nonomuraea sp. FMUSA5-5]